MVAIIKKLYDSGWVASIFFFPFSFWYRNTYKIAWCFPMNDISEFSIAVIPMVFLLIKSYEKCLLNNLWL